MLKFISRHKGIIKFILIICFVIISISLIKYFDSQILGIAVGSIILFLSFISLALVDVFLTANAMNKFNASCDCQSLYEFTAQFLKEKNPPNVKQTHIINHAFCLQQMGKFNEALNLLSTITITEHTPMNLRLVYYNNLGKLYGCLKDKDEAEKYYLIFKEIYDNLLNKKLKNKYTNIFVVSESEHYYRIGQYEKALSVIKLAEPENLYGQVCKRYLLALICLKLNDIDTAKSELNFVVNSGNTIYFVNEAKEILKNI